MTEGVSDMLVQNKMSFSSPMTVKAAPSGVFVPLSGIPLYITHDVACRCSASDVALNCTNCPDGQTIYLRCYLPFGRAQYADELRIQPRHFGSPLSGISGIIMDGGEDDR